MSLPEQSPAMTGRRPPALVMNLYYTGLGIARSLGERGVRVIGLTATRGIYGNFTRYAETVFCPDSSKEPEKLAAFLADFGRQLGERGVIFPTRDSDLVFLDRFRAKLEPYYSIVAPSSKALATCLDKFATSRAAQLAQIPSPKCWIVEGPDELNDLARGLTYPCVLKPVSSHEWRHGNNWELVGARKAIGISSTDELLFEYETIARAEKRAVVQEMVPGGDGDLLIAACYLDRDSRYVAGFQVQKLVQVPEGFGTGCIVQSVDRPELLEPAIRLLQSIRFTGIAEVEFKRDAATGAYKLIEINPRPWDQHRLGKYCGVELMYLAYCEHAGLPVVPPGKPAPGHKWIAEDVFFTTALTMLFRRDRRLRDLFRHARGKRLFAIWSANDPLPSICYALSQFLPQFIGTCMRRMWVGFRQTFSKKRSEPKRGVVYERHQEN